MNLPPNSHSKRILVLAHAAALRTNRVIHRKMVEAGHRVHLVLPKAAQNMEPPTTEGITFVELERREDNSSTRFYSYEGLEEVFEGFEPNLVLLDLEPDSKLAVQVSRLCSRSGQPEIPFFIQTCENLSIWESSKGSLPAVLAKWLVRKRYLSQVRSSVTHLFPISTQGGSLLDGFGFRGRVTPIPLGIDTDHFRPDPESRSRVRVELGIPPDVPVVAYFGRVTAAKGVHQILEALLQCEDLPWAFLLNDFIADADTYMDRIESLLETPLLKERVHRFRCPHQEMPAYMNVADLVVMPSMRTNGWLEQFGRVAAEILGCGNRLLSSDSGALPEVGGPVSSQFPEGNTEELLRLLRIELKRPRAEVDAGASGRRQWAVDHLSVQHQWELMRPILGL